MLNIAKWYNNFQAPAVLMIDDLSDAYIGVYEENYKNDWGYLCDKNNSSFDFLTKELLNFFPKIKITFFTPYLKHAVVSENSRFNYKKYAVGEREEFTAFLKLLEKKGHEISHHGSDHGKYINEKIPSTAHNWIHEWALFNEIDAGVKVTLTGVIVFKDECNIDIIGGKYCGYITKDNSHEIIDKCNFLYWCDKPSYNIGEYEEGFFGKNDIISFPTNFAGNSFVRLTYLSGDDKRDKKKKILKYFQPIYNMYSYIQLSKLYKAQNIISIQEHNSPSTSAGTVQSANIITDMESLNKIFKYLSKLSIWYATCSDIGKYIYVRENTTISLINKELIINFKNKKNILNPLISIVNKENFSLKDKSKIYTSTKVNNLYVVNLSIVNGRNILKYLSI